MTERKQATIGIYIGTEQKGFFISLAKILAERHKVWFIARDQNVKKVILERVPELGKNIIVLSEYNPKVDAKRVVEESVKREKQYGEAFSMIMSYDRALGQGYLFNADRHPHIIRSTWPHTRKLNTVLEQFLRFEQIFDSRSFDMLLGHDRPLILDVIANHHGVKYLTLGLSRYENNYLWFENRYEEKERYTELIKSALREEETEDEGIAYKPYGQYMATARLLDYSYLWALRRASYIFAHEVYVHLRRIHKRDSYGFAGWIPSLFRSPNNYRYLLKHGTRPEETEKYKIVYFALHQEPESALMSISPEFNNSMEIMAWVSKSLPADTLLIVKENPWAFGVRSRGYYRNLMKISNLHFAHPAVPSWEWINRANLVVTITGTVGFEAVYFGKPVLSFGAHQIINHLPTVRYANSFFSTRQHLEELLGLDPKDRRFMQSRRALHRALQTVSFSMPGYEKIYKRSDLHEDLARKAAERLHQEYPGLLGK
jgi:hypothetical protein